MNSEVNEVLKTLSNAAPAYLECMQRIVFSIDKVDGSTDVECFVMEHERLLEEPPIPTLKLHEYYQLHSRSNRKAKTEKSSDNFKNEDADDKLQKSLTDSKPAVAPKPSSITSSSATGSSTSIVTAGFLKPTPPQKKSFFKSKPTQSVKPVISTTKEKTDPEPTSITKTESPSTNDTIIPTTTEVIATYVKTTPTSTEAMPTSTEAPPTGTKATQNKSPSRERSVTTATNKPSRAVKPHTLSSPPPPPQDTNNGSFSESQDSLFAQLMRKTKQSDYYGLLGVLPTADQEELSRARREIVVKLHPDLFTNDRIKQEKAQERLIIINQAYNDVLSNKTNRELYDQLVRYREKYHRILEQTGPSLDTAKMKLSSLRSSMKKARFPMTLLEELQLAIRLIEDKQLQLGATVN